MIKIEGVVLPSTSQWLTVIQGMRNPMNSWDKSDSFVDHLLGYKDEFWAGINDLKLMTQLSEAGTDHRKFMRMLPVYATITAPLYWWSEYDTYKVGTVANSCSKMHKIHTEPIELKDFSVDDFTYNVSDEAFELATEAFARVIDATEALRKAYNETKDKKYWRMLIQLLPESYNQKRTIMLNYEVLSNMYKSRKSHKLEEWRDFCKWVETLPYSQLITHE